MDRYELFAKAVDLLDALARSYRSLGNRRLAARLFDTVGDLPHETAVRDAFLILDQAVELEDSLDAFMAQFRAEMRPAIAEARKALTAYEQAVA